MPLYANPVNLHDSVATQYAPIQPISPLCDSILNYGKMYLGTRYRSGSQGPNGFDCSGFTSYIFNKFGFNLKHSSAAQSEQFPHINKDDIQPGDLVFFNGHRRGSRVGHVGVVVAKHDSGAFDFMHAAFSGGIIVSNSEEAYYKRRYLKAGRVLNDLYSQTSIPTTESNEQETHNATPNEEKIVSPTTQQEKRAVKKKIPAKYHFVKSGETLTEIAANYGLTVKELKHKNNLKNDFLMLKQQLKVKDEQTKTEYQTISTSEKLPADSLNLKSIAQQTTATTPTSTTDIAAQAFYEVQKGETLYGLSKRFHCTVEELKQINNLQEKKLQAGQKIKLPSINQQSELHTTSQPNQDKHIIKASKSNTHIIKKGETLSDIAEKYNCSVNQLKKWNLKRSNRIDAGEKLIINK
ncbi:MAG: hypothetical protein AUK44_01755 [Porphyromonadaceae bacterium CG2_30_38_12]|nr:MAG: hypothetical protein AUK44_01755 [Porphyromonadaceae bacterium CG2_30_38_12]